MCCPTTGRAFPCHDRRSTENWDAPIIVTTALRDLAMFRNLQALARRRVELSVQIAEKQGPNRL
jgi:hypothetical protein